MKILPPLAALAVSAMALAACGNDDKLADNTYSTPAERDASGYPSAQPAAPSPGTLGNPDATTVPPSANPANPDDPQPMPPGSPPTPLPN